MRTHPHKIKAKSHILNLLGNELIGNDGLAIFELVKNAYDADAESVTVEFVDLNASNQKIIIEDDGHGMSPEIINNVWLTIGTDSKRGKNRKPSPKFNRISLGEKGVGRLAVHKLAKKITLETQVAGNMFSNRFTIDWQELVKSSEFIQDLEVDIELIGESLFEKGHGTRIILSGLYNTTWTKASLRELVRKIENIKNPFADIKDFTVEVKAGKYENWIKGIKSSTEILKDSLYQFEFEILPSLSSNGGETSKYLDELALFKWSYVFNPPTLTKIPKREIPKITSESLEKIEEQAFLIGDILNPIEEKRKPKYLRNRDLAEIGPIKGRFYVFNQDSKILNQHFGGQVTAVKEYIKVNCGVRIYRDNIRVYNYGEPYDDWLGLDLMKIQRAGDHFGKKVTIGAIELDLEKSEKGLQEKTNREGFNENNEFKRLQSLIRYIFQFFEKEAQKDKDLIEEYIDGFKAVNRVGFSDTIIELTEKLKEKNLDEELSPLIKRVEKDYTEMRDVMLNSGMTGLNLGVIFHEVDREMKFINSDLNASKINIEEIRGRVKNLIQLLDNFSPILKQNEKNKLSASNLVQRAKDIHLNRYNYHNIIFSSPLTSRESEDFEINGPGHLLLTMLSNLIDNSIYWVKVKRELEGKDYKCGIYITSDTKTFGAPAIIIADNGTGFSLNIEELVQPFKTSKPGGMGLGLYYSNMVMEIIGGKLLFPDSADLEIPSVYNGACVAIVFSNK